MNPQKAAEIARFVDVFVNTNMSLKEILSQYKTNEVISHYKPEDIISGLDASQLKKLKKQLNSIELG